jgi:hypothetical protein
MRLRPQLRLAATACLAAALSACAAPHAHWSAAPRPAARVVEPSPLSRLGVAGPPPAAAHDERRPARPRPVAPRRPAHRFLAHRHFRPAAPAVCDLAHGLWPQGSLPDALCRSAYR